MRVATGTVASTAGHGKCAPPALSRYRDIVTLIFLHFLSRGKQLPILKLMLSCVYYLFNHSLTKTCVEVDRYRIGSLALPCLHCNPRRCTQCPVSPWDWAQQVPELHLCPHSVIRTLHILTESFLLRYAGMAADIHVFVRIFSNSIQWIKLIYKIWSEHNTGLKVSSHRKYLNFLYHINIQRKKGNYKSKQ